MNKEKIISEYRKEKNIKAKKVFKDFIIVVNYLLWLTLAGANFIFIGVLYMAFYQTGTLDILKIWLLPLFMGGVACFLLAFFFGSELGKNEK